MKWRFEKNDLQKKEEEGKRGGGRRMEGRREGEKVADDMEESTVWYIVERA